MARRDALIEHLLRRLGFGGSPADVEGYADLGYATALDRLINYETVADDVDDKIGQPGYAGLTLTSRLDASVNIGHARQRWLFRMIHTERPLQEKMALFWHNHFATAYSKVNGTFGPVQGTKLLANVSGQLPGPQGQLETFRKLALGSFTELLIEVAKDPAILVWLDGRVNTR